MGPIKFSWFLNPDSCLLDAHYYDYVVLIWFDACPQTFYYDVKGSMRLHLFLSTEALVASATPTSVSPGCQPHYLYMSSALQASLSIPVHHATSLTINTCPPRHEPHYQYLPTTPRASLSIPVHHATSLTINTCPPRHEPHYQYLCNLSTTPRASLSIPVPRVSWSRRSVLWLSQLFYVGRQLRVHRSLPHGPDRIWSTEAGLVRFNAVGEHNERYNMRLNCYATSVQITVL